MYKARLFGCFLLTFYSVSAACLAATEPTSKDKQTLRIIALAPHIVESLYEIGAGEQIVGTTDHADYPAEAANIPLVGNHARLQIERIVELAPDMIIAWKTGNPVDDLDRLRRYNIPIVYSNPLSLDDVAEEIRTYGKLTGRVKQAEDIAANYSAKLTQLRHTYADKAPINTFYELWPTPLRTVANKAWPQQQLTVCGAKNPFEKLEPDYPQVGLEQVVVSLPQVIIQPNRQAAQTQDTLHWQKWPHIPAVQHNFIFHPNPDKAHRMTTRMLDELALLCENIDQARTFYTNHD